MRRVPLLRARRKCRPFEFQMSGPRSSLASGRGRRTRSGRADDCAAFPPNLFPFHVRRERVFRCRQARDASILPQVLLLFLLCALRPPDSELPSNFPLTSSLLAHFLLPHYAPFLRFPQIVARNHESNPRCDFAALPFARVPRRCLEP